MKMYRVKEGNEVLYLSEAQKENYLEVNLGKKTFSLKEIKPSAILIAITRIIGVTAKVLLPRKAKNLLIEKLTKTKANYEAIN